MEAFDIYSNTIIIKELIPLRIEKEKTEQEKEKTKQIIEKERTEQEKERTEQEKEKTKQMELNMEMEIEKKIIDNYSFDCFIKYYEMKKSK